MASSPPLKASRSTAACDMTTPFGWPVDPEVYIT